MSGAPAALLRPLLLVVAVLGLLGTGGVELVARPGGASAVSVLAGATTTAALSTPLQRADAQAPGAVLRPGLAPTSTPTAGGPALPPPASVTVAPHLLTRPQGRPPTAPHLAAAWSSASGRAPPLTTGT